MEGVSRGEPTNAVLKTGFEWGKLRPNAVVVDVGGGKGHVSLEIAQQHSHLRFVIQDRPRVIAEAKDVRAFVALTYQFLAETNKVLGTENAFRFARRDCHFAR